MSEPATTPASRNHRRQRALRLLAAAFTLAALATLAWWLLVARYRSETDNAYVAGNVVQISPRVNGTVVAIRAEDTDLVEQGQVLLELDDADARVALQAAEAALAEAVREVRGLYLGTGQSAAVVAQRTADIERLRQEAARAQAELQRARDDYARQEALYRDRFISADALQGRRSTLQSAQAARAAAQAAIREAESALVQAREQKSGSEVRVDNTSLENHPRVAAAASQVRAAYLALIRTKVVAPVRGYIARRSVQLGERVSTGNALMAVVPASELWVEANFKETDLQDVRIDQPATLSSDLWGSKVVYHGRVVGMSAGTGGAFALLPAQNASGNWIKIVQRVPVRIALDPAELAEHPLRIGLSMRVSIDTHDREGTVLAASPRLGGGIETPVFADQLEAADSLIESVITANRSANGRR